LDKGVLTENIKSKAKETGFDAVGIAPIGLVPGDRLLDWLARGYHGRMAYLARNLEKRLDPSTILPGARSVVCCALCYPHTDSRSDFQGPRAVACDQSFVQEGSSGTARVSHYARGEDYHDVLSAKLEDILGFVRQLIPGVQGKTYVDTGPVMEKWWAAQAGIGWQGKHTNLLSRDLGSWFFLGELILDLDLEYDSPVPDYCGTCTRCIDACPTQAIVAPYVLDASRCVSYLTIELKEEMPEELRQPIGDMVFGCDICQQVCPWNSRAPEVDDDDFAPADDLAAPSLRDLARLTPEQFRERFRKSPISRPKWRGFMRNVAMALGNAGDPSAIPELEQLLDCEDEMVRDAAAWALGQIQGKGQRGA